MEMQKSNVIFWIKQPSSWLATIATLISLITFFIVYEYKGKLIVTLPDRIGICATGDLSLIVPLSITNTGAPRTVRNVIRITAYIEDIAPLKEYPTKVFVRWRMETKFVPIPGSTSHLHDSIGYVNRVVPFAVHGGISSEKVFNFIQNGTGFEKKIIDNFTIRVRVETDNGTFYSRKSYYNCNHMDISQDLFQYCEMPYEGNENF